MTAAEEVKESQAVAEEVPPLAEHVFPVGSGDSWRWHGAVAAIKRWGRCVGMLSWWRVNGCDGGRVWVGISVWLGVVAL